jgi:hypothetical protein
MKYAVEMDSVAVIYVPSLIKIGSGIQKLLGGIHRHTETSDNSVLANVSIPAVIRIETCLGASYIICSV